MENDHSGDRQPVTPIAAVVWVGAEPGDTAERNAATEPLESLTWLELTGDRPRLGGKIQADLRRDGPPISVPDGTNPAIAIDDGETRVTGEEAVDRISGQGLGTY